LEGTGITWFFVIDVERLPRSEDQRALSLSSSIAFHTTDRYSSAHCQGTLPASLSNCRCSLELSLCRTSSRSGQNRRDYPDYEGHISPILRSVITTSVSSAQHLFHMLGRGNLLRQFRLGIVARLAQAGGRDLEMAVLAGDGRWNASPFLRSLQNLPLAATLRRTPSAGELRRGEHPHHRTKRRGRNSGNSKVSWWSLERTRSMTKSNMTNPLALQCRQVFLQSR
jgi:hypothetical protein